MREGYKRLSWSPDRPKYEDKEKIWQRRKRNYFYYYGERGTKGNKVREIKE